MGFDLPRFIASRRRALQRALPKEVLVLGGMDISLNTFDNRDEHWQAHWYLLMTTIKDTPGNRKLIEKAIPVEPTAHVPIDYATVSEEDFPRVVSYAMKATFYRRSGYRDENGAMNATPQRMKREQDVELALALAQFSLGSRLILKGLRRYYSGTGFKLREI